MRILVTGSRNWDDYESVYLAIADAAGDNWPVTVVQGGAPGADRLAEVVAYELGCEVETHPAAWNTYGKAAGPIRNKKMVDQGADVCLAFILDGSKGAIGCAKLAEEAGIPVHRYVAFS